MTIALHLVGCFMLLPYLGLSAFMLFVQRAAESKNLLSVFDLMLNAALAFINWGGLLLLLAWLTLLLLGLFPATQRVGAALLLGLALACLAIIAIVQPTPLDAGQLLFLAPCALVAVAAAWSVCRTGV